MERGDGNIVVATATLLLRLPLLDFRGKFVLRGLYGGENLFVFDREDVAAQFAGA
jgi:hypothetical protein